jgi:hypothetical protein
MDDSSSLYIPGSIAKEEGEESSSVDKERLGDLRSKDDDDLLLLLWLFFDNKNPSSSVSEGGGEGTEASIPLPLPLPSTDGLVAGKNPVEERNAALEEDNPDEEDGFNPPDPRGRGSLLCRNTPLLPPPPLLIPPPLLLLEST